jgi:hypothetical protein
MKNPDNEFRGVVRNNFVYCIERLQVVSLTTPKKQIMSNKTRSFLKILAICLVILAVLMHLEIVMIPALASMRFWMVVIGFSLVVISSR